MKVTLEIPDELHRKLKEKAAVEGTTMRALILRGLAISKLPKTASPRLK
jgi:hypothetical protein